MQPEATTTREDFRAAKADAVVWADLCAALVLDVSGNIVAANRSARELWEIPDKVIVHLPLTALFAADQAAAEEPAEMQWNALRAAALDKWARRTAYPQQGSPREVRIRIERAFGGAGTYIATIQPQA